MKILVAWLLSMLFLSCGMSKDEKSKIETMIILHNVNVGGRFASDSIKEMERLTIENLRIHKEPEFEDYLRTKGRTYKNNWNTPYEISKDFNLTFDKYTEYCEANNKDPKTFYKFMD